MIGERAKTCSLCGYFLFCCSLTDEDDECVWMHFTADAILGSSQSKYENVSSPLLSVYPHVTIREPPNVICLLHLILRSFANIC